MLDNPVASLAYQGTQQQGLVNTLHGQLVADMARISDLDSVLIEMIVKGAAYPTISFDSIVDLAASGSGGRLLFNMRVDSHADIRRVAAIASTSGGGVTLLLLDFTDMSIEVCEATTDLYPVVVAIARWTNQPLNEQVSASCEPALLKLLDALSAS
ncbi:hypothetical protein [Mesorhizobium sp. DCY119]|uniref:hypothetical protein n=1 Tax=Mesorhizobium sp. DCY119 TaxID=2108445 RepID=UPI000E71CA55|nr:hypothetical protein [Mesorhizobium sp. DCY119]RJG40649.1 hypothetical protein D3Y55_25640 [Mesorhizobium sp. DCY119]